MTDIVERLRDEEYWKACSHRQTRAERLEAAAEIERLRDPWLPIDTAPKVDGDELLLWEGVLAVGRWCAADGVWQAAAGDGISRAFPTHWMPKPAPPKGEA